MADDTLLESYNYREFVPANFEPWLRFEHSPPLGERVPDFPLWRREDRGEIGLHELLRQRVFTVVEFGSFT